MLKYERKREKLLNHFYSNKKVMKIEGKNIEVYNAQKDIIDLFDNFITMASEARYKAIKETKRKIIKTNTRAMLQRLPPDNTTDKLLTEITQIVCSLYRTFTIKICNKIIKSIHI